MKKLLATGLIAAAMLPFASARADHGKHDDRDGNRSYVASNGKYEDTYWDGNCEVKREWKKNGKYKEQRKCRAPGYIDPAAIPSYPVAPAGPGIVVNGTAVIRP
jgi:hypothetical protein